MSDPLRITLTRALIYNPAVELQVRADAGALTIEASGAWPLLDFEKGSPVAMTPLSDKEFVAVGGDQTRVTFETDSAGKVTTAILNRGPWEQRGTRIDMPAQ
jgi:hypothetical protein